MLPPPCGEGWEGVFRQTSGRFARRRVLTGTPLPTSPARGEELPFSSGPGSLRQYASRVLRGGSGRGSRVGGGIIVAVASRYLTEERLELQSRAREFALREALPLANQLDRQKADIPRWFLERMAGMGYFGITIPREFGGLGLGVFEYCLISEELARAWMSVASVIARGNGMGTQVQDLGRRRELLER